MVLVYVVYLPLYTIYQMAVLVLMILYLINKSSDIVNSSQENPNSTEVRIRQQHPLHPSSLSVTYYNTVQQEAI